MDQKIIVIMGDKAMAIEGYIVAVAPAAKLLETMLDMGRSPLVMLPHSGPGSCAAMVRFERRRFFLMYQPPGVRPLFWTNKANGERKTFSLAWPHFYIGLFFKENAIEHGFAMVSRKRLESTKDMLSRLPLPNTSGAFGHICEGQRGMWNITDPAVRTAVSYVDYFLKSDYISDINDHYRYVPKVLWPADWDLGLRITPESVEAVNVAILEKWQKLTSDDDVAAMEDIEWNNDFSIADLVKDTWRKREGDDGIDPKILDELVGQGI